MNPRRFFRPGRVVRRAVRRNVRRQSRRYYRRRSRRLLLSGAVILALAGTHRSYKFRDDDVQRLENYYDRPAEDLTEDEIVHGMKKLGIQKIELDDDDQVKIYEADDEDEGFKSSGVRYCMNCGDLLDQGANFCTNCGARVKY